MKLLLALTLSLFAGASMACTDFSGSYRDDEQETYSVAQSGCAKITVNSSEGTDTIIADGQFRVTEENEDVIITSASSFVGATLTINGKIEYKFPFPPEVPAEMVPVRSLTIYTLDSAGNLIMDIAVYNSNNQVLGQATQSHQKI